MKSLTLPVNPAHLTCIIISYIIPSFISYTFSIFLLKPNTVRLFEANRPGSSQTPADPNLAPSWQEIGRPISQILLDFQGEAIST